ncbi:DUF1501 domain-containing protein [Candidatus Poribacteria bacterium]|nr:DUF1501 domain-containing protein [Candidatus Poribacteria bacterium]
MARTRRPSDPVAANHLLDTHLTRRSLIKSGLYGMFSAALLGPTRTLSALSTPQSPAKAKHCILLFMNGGPTQTDTFDPKTGTSNGGPFRALKTSAPDIQLSEHLPLVAEQAHHLTLIRSMVTKEGNHSRARYLMHTGYAPTNSVQHPTIGSILAAEIGDSDFDLPNAVTINSPAFDAAYLGAQHDPFYVPDPLKGVENLSYAPETYRERFRARMELVSFLNGEFARRVSSTSSDRDAVYVKADKMMHSPLTNAFELDQEPMAIREAYGMNAFGQGCLMARRLVESGVRFVEVSLDGWDTHQNNFEAVKRLLGNVDPGMGTLIRDLADRDLLKDTLVLWMGEFGRTPKINANDGRDHWPNGWTVAMAGGGLRGGRVIGATDEAGENVVSSPVSTTDFFYSLCALFGIDPAHVNYSRVGRPIKIVDGGTLIPEFLPAAG